VDIAFVISSISSKIENHLHCTRPLSSLLPEPWQSVHPPLRARTILRSRKKRRPLVLPASMLNCGSQRWLSVELALHVRLGICSSGWLRLGLRSRSRSRFATRQRFSKVVYSEPALARLPHEAQGEQTTLHNPRRCVWRPTRPVRPRPNSQIGHHQNRTRRLDTHHRNAQCPNKLELPRRVDLWCVLDHCERRGGQAKEPSPKLDGVRRVDRKRRCAN